MSKETIKHFRSYEVEMAGLFQNIPNVENIAPFLDFS